MLLSSLIDRTQCGLVLQRLVLDSTRFRKPTAAIFQVYKTLSSLHATDRCSTLLLSMRSLNKRLLESHCRHDDWGSGSFKQIWSLVEFEGLSKSSISKGHSMEQVHTFQACLLSTIRSASLSSLVVLGPRDIHFRAQ